MTHTPQDLDEIRKLFEGTTTSLKIAREEESSVDGRRAYDFAIGQVEELRGFVRQILRIPGQERVRPTTAALINRTFLELPPDVQEQLRGLEGVAPGALFGIGNIRRLWDGSDAEGRENLLSGAGITSNVMSQYGW